MLIGNTPVARLNRIGGGRVFLKLETFSPNATYFDRLALALVERAGVTPGATVREAGDAALCVALAAQCRRLGASLEAWLPEDVALEVHQSLELWGAKLSLTPFEAGPEGSRIAGRGQGPLISESRSPVRLEVARALGRELCDTVREDGGRIDAFVAGCGTGATLTGVMRELRAAWPSVEGVAVQPAGAEVIDPGAWKPHRQPGLGGHPGAPLLERTLISRTVEVSDEAAWKMRTRLGKEEGLLLSLGSAAAVAAAERLADEKGDCRVYALAVDTGEREFSLEGFF